MSKVQRSARTGFGTVRAGVILLILFAAVSAIADTTITIGNGSGLAGTTVLVPVQFQTDANLVALQFEVRFDTAFSQVIRECGAMHRRGQRGSWIIPEIIEAYEVLHSMGHAHSVEAYQDGVLVGGLYGMSVGRVFCGESMFAKVSDASKVAFSVLVERLKEWGYDFIDCQVPTDHLKSLGAKEVSREYFLERLGMCQNNGLPIGSWK